MGELGQREPGPPNWYDQGRSGPGQKLTTPRLTPSAFWNEDPQNRWFDPSNLGTAMLDGVKTTCLIDNGAWVDLVTPEFMKNRGLEVGSIQDLNDHDGYIPLSGLGGKITEPLGYVILRVQIPYVPSYDEDQVALVVSEDSNFLKRCQVILGTLTINRAVRAMKDIPQEHAGAFFNTILQVSCSFRQEMDNMATNQVLIPCQIVPNLWGSCRGLLEGLSLLDPPSCSASWPATLVERVTAVPACQNVPGSSKTPTKSNLPPPRAAKNNPGFQEETTPFSQTSHRAILEG